MEMRWTKCLWVAGVLLIAAAVLFTSGCGDSRHVFFVALDDTSSLDNVNVFRLDRSTGELTQVAGSPFETGLDSGAAAVVHPVNGRWVFVADWTGNVQSLVLDSSGTPTVASTENTGYDDFGWVNGLAVTPDGKYLYTTTDTADIVEWSIDQTTGALTRIGTYTTPLLCTDAVAASGGFLYITSWCDDYNIQVATIANDGTLSDLETVAVPDTGSYLWTVAVDKTGQFLYVGDESATLTRYTVANDGTLTYQGQTVRNAGDGDMDSISFSADNMYLYTTTDRTGTAVFAVDQGTGDLTEIADSPFGTEDSYGMVLVDPSDKFVYVSDDGSDIVGYKRDMVTGALSPLSGALPTTFTTKYEESFGFAITY